MTLNSAESDLVSNVFSKGMQNPAIVLHDEEGGNVTELEDFSCVSEQNSCGPTAINIENSKDVIVGPVTQFHGPVTIYHNSNGVPGENIITNGNKTISQNGKLVKSESSSSDSFPGAEKSNTNSSQRFRRLTYIGIAVVIAVAIVVTLCATMLPTNKIEQEETSSSTIFNKVNHSQGNNVGGIEPVTSGSLISRVYWKAQNTNYTNPLQHPTSLVIICHTVTSSCETFSQCSQKVSNIQADQLNRGFDDISYNFLIGRDGNAYVGRGWDTRNIISDNSVSIAFIGNFVKEFLSDSMIRMAKTLIQNGVKNGKLSVDYKVVCHNQTTATVSPGRHVYEEVKKWSHFDPSYYLSKSDVIR